MRGVRMARRCAARRRLGRRADRICEEASRLGGLAAGAEGWPPNAVPVLVLRCTSGCPVLSFGSATVVMVQHRRP